jgi:hypothetical protein
MRLSICAAVFASVSLVQQCTAVPAFRTSEQGPGAKVAKVDEAEALKYFHEAGYVAVSYCWAGREG